MHVADFEVACAKLVCLFWSTGESRMNVEAVRAFLKTLEMLRQCQYCKILFLFKDSLRWELEIHIV